MYCCSFNKDGQSNSFYQAFQENPSKKIATASFQSFVQKMSAHSKGGQGVAVSFSPSLIILGYGKSPSVPKGFGGNL